MEQEVLNEDIKRYQRILEYINMGNNISEEGEDPNAAPAPGGDPNAMGGDPNAMGGAPAPGGDPNAMGGDSNAMGGDPNAMGGDPNAMGGDPNAMGGDPNAAQGPEGFDPQVADPNAGGDPNTMGDDPNAMGDPDAMGGEQPGPDDNVIDIDDLTAAQDETSSAIADVNTKIEKLLGVMDKFDKFIDKNNAEIEALKKELEERNPTPIEKLDLRTVNDSYPFNVKPTDYWSEKEATSNYRVGGDEKEVPEQYDLRVSDLNNANWKEIADSLDDFDEMNDITKLLKL